MNLRLLMGTAIGALVATSANAQTADSQTAEPAAQASQGVSEETGGLQEIIVTAQRRSESLQRAAVAVSVVTAQSLQAAGVTQPSDLSATVPALQTAPASGTYPLFYVRGVGNFAATILNDPAISFNVDGVYVGRPSGTTGYFYDIERIEVLKGPQGTLYGRNATGGAINVITKTPELGTLGGSVSASYGNYDAINLNGAVNVPLGDQAALRVAGTWVKHDAYMDDGTDNQNDRGGRLSFLLKPNDGFSLRLIADYFRQTGRGGGSTPTGLGIDGRHGLMSPEAQAFISQNPNFVLGRTEPSIASMCGGPDQPCSFVDNERWGVTAIMDVETPIGTLTAIPAYLESNVHYLSYQQASFIGPDEHNSQASLEVRLASEKGKPVEYLLGAFLYDESNKDPLFINTTTSSKGYINQSQNTKSWALFGRLSYEVAPDFRIGGGLRYTNEKRELNSFANKVTQICVAGFPNCPTAVPFPLYPLDDIPPLNFIPGPTGTITIDRGAPYREKNLSNSKVTYRASADWQITPRNLLYASFETGFKSGGFYETIDAGIYRPETITAWTIGSKNTFLNNRLLINAEAFWWTYKDQQIAHLINDSRGIAILATENVGKSTVRGAELELRYLPLENTQLSADIQYLDSKYDTFLYTTSNTNRGAGNGTACPSISVTSANYVVDCSGKRPPFAPKWTMNLGVEQTVPVSFGKFVGQFRARYQSRTLTGFEFLPIQEQEAYWNLGASLSFRTLNDGLNVTAFVNNLTNKTVLGYTFPAIASTYMVSTLQPPRTYGLRIGYNF